MPRTEAFDDIAANFDFLDDWEDRYRYVIELGKNMPELEEVRRTPATKVDGCASQVWLVPEVRDGADGPVLHFEGDSDAMIVRGLIAVLIALVSGQRLADIREMDIPAELAALELDQALSAQRSNGLRAMVTRIEDIAGSSQAA
ncbi:MAG: SufE family protein [Pseudomonadota bacterium]